MKEHHLKKGGNFMALPVQIQYWEYLENKRHNINQEVAAARQAAAAEEQAKAATKNADTNYLNYGVNKSNAESNRIIALAQQENARINAENARINAMNAETNRLNYEVNLKNAETNYSNYLVNAKNAETNRLNYSVNQQNADTNRYVAEYQEVLGYGNLAVAKDNAQTNKMDMLGKQDVYSSQVAYNKANTENVKASTAYTRTQNDYYPTVVKTNTATSWINTVVNAITKTGGTVVDMKRAFAPVRAK